MGSSVCTVSWEKTIYDNYIFSMLNIRAKSLCLNMVHENLGRYVAGNNHFVCGLEGTQLIFTKPNFIEFEKQVVDIFNLCNVKYQISNEHLPC
jgi:hypothetical protein